MGAVCSRSNPLSARGAPAMVSALSGEFKTNEIGLHFYDPANVVAGGIIVFGVFVRA